MLQVQYFSGHTDIYGRRFLALIPRKSKTQECEIHVTGHFGTQNVGVGATQRIITGVLERETIVYNCTGLHDEDDTPFWIISDQDVFVTMVFKNSANRIGAYQVYPVDALGKQMMGITDDGDFTDCFLATAEYPAIVTVFYEGSKPNLNVADGYTIALEPGKVHRIAGSSPDIFKGVLFQADRPICMFCGDYSVYPPERTEFFQIPPTENLGKEYVTPAFEPIIVERPFDATLLIQADSDNTLVTINGDFEAIIPIYKRGQFI